MTQSAFSHQLKALESHYGTSLFERNTKPLRFTPAGTRLLTLASDVAKLTEQAEREVLRLAAGGAGQLRVAVECHTCFDWLLPAMDAFRQRWPDVELDVVRHFLMPAGIKPRRRNIELTVAILQLVASGRGVAALPRWSVSSYLERGYVIGKRLNLALSIQLPSLFKYKAMKLFKKIYSLFYS